MNIISFDLPKSFNFLNFSAKRSSSVIIAPPCPVDIIFGAEKEKLPSDPAFPYVCRQDRKNLMTVQHPQ